VPNYRILIEVNAEDAESAMDAVQSALGEDDSDVTVINFSLVSPEADEEDFAEAEAEAS
jgi:hypothetical protein